MKKVIANAVVIENDAMARVCSVPTARTIDRIKEVYGLSQCGNPNGKTDRIKGNDGTLYKIRPMEDLDDRIYIRWDGDAKVIDTCYAVFKRNGNVWQQVTKWYSYFGVAQRHMLRKAGYIQ